ncbi:MAG TPA: helix-turn-helix transcriptional regulator [Longimicrobiales bacterium]|nr:helix-turn-helix transcriptional regulator [Longimicrobiales bacterium]
MGTPGLYRLEQRGLLKAAWVTSITGRRTKAYSVTAAGRKQLAEQRTEWKRFSGALAAILQIG